MLSTKKVLTQIFTKVGAKNKPQRDFLKKLFTLLPCIRGRFNFVNIARYTPMDESTIRRNFTKFFDWLSFNFCIIQLSLSSSDSRLIAAVDASFISKSGKKTFGLGRFWSGCANRTKKGLEISVLALIEMSTGNAWSLDVAQTPTGLSSKEGAGQNYTRIDFYIEQILDCTPYLKTLRYIVADGYYAKKKMFDALLSINKHLITKLRPDANMRYLLDRQKNPNAHGNQKYDGKVDWPFLNLHKWIEIGVHPKYPHLLVYSQELYSIQFQRNLKVVVLINTNNGKYILLASTNLFQSAFEIIEMYSLRFQIEFLFRDAKQFTGLNHCQARDQHKLDFHFNMSMAAVNLYHLEIQLNQQTDKSMNSFIRKAHNTKVVELIFDQLNSNAELRESLNPNHPEIQKIINLGQMRYKNTA